MRPEAATETDHPTCPLAEDVIRNDVVTRLAHSRPSAVYRVNPETFRRIALRLDTAIFERVHPAYPDLGELACLELRMNGHAALVFTGAESGGGTVEIDEILRPT